MEQEVRAQLRRETEAQQHSRIEEEVLEDIIDMNIRIAGKTTAATELLTPDQTDKASKGKRFYWLS